MGWVLLFHQPVYVGDDNHDDHLEPFILENVNDSVSKTHQPDHMDVKMLMEVTYHKFTK